jgi:hypothetical protein
VGASWNTFPSLTPVVGLVSMFELAKWSRAITYPIYFLELLFKSIPASSEIPCSWDAIIVTNTTTKCGCSSLIPIH